MTDVPLGQGAMGLSIFGICYDWLLECQTCMHICLCRQLFSQNFLTRAPTDSKTMTGYTIEICCTFFEVNRRLSQISKKALKHHLNTKPLA